MGPVAEDAAGTEAPGLHDVVSLLSVSFFLCLFCTSFVLKLMLLSWWLEASNRFKFISHTKLEKMSLFKKMPRLTNQP